MAITVHCDIVSADESLFSGLVEMIVATGSLAAAAEAVKQAETALANQTGEIEYSKAAAMLAESTAQLRTVQTLRKKLGG